MDIDVVERLLRPENLEVSLKYVLKHEAEDDGWKAREETVHGRRMGKSSGMTLSIKETRQKLCRAPTAPCRLTSFSKARRRPKEEEAHRVVMEDRRRRRIAIENLAKGMLRYLDSSDDAKVGITELQERVEVPLQFGISIQQVAQLARSEIGQKIFEVIWQEEELCIARWEAQR